MFSTKTNVYKPVRKKSYKLNVPKRTGTNAGVIKKRSQKKYHLPVIGHFAEASIEFNSIIEAEAITGINYTLIFEACIGKIYKAKNVMWEFKKGNHYIKYKAYYINIQDSYTRKSGFNG